MFKKKNNELEINNDIAVLVKEARLKKGLSARKLAELCDISHTEINNIERGIRVKPAILTLKGFEKYLDLPFEKIAKLAGYSDVTIDFTEENITQCDMAGEDCKSYNYKVENNILKIDNGLAPELNYTPQSVVQVITKDGVEL